MTRQRPIGARLEVHRSNSEGRRAVELRGWTPKDAPSGARASADGRARAHGGARLLRRGGPR
eukprot:8326192-Alexandrium_andersonii.AAC.1